MDSDDDNVIAYGTPLEIDEEEDDLPRKKKPIPIDQQIVTDERGLRRFHGAFTGGFSAGYFNTAGSKEGWVPTTFQSSRSSRAQKAGQRPEDFMDAEDLGAFGIAPRSIHVTKDFREENVEEGSKKRTHKDVFGSAIPGFPLKDFIIPVKNSIGVQILKSMGWKQGQGIGPRVKLREKLRMTEEEDEKQSGGKVYGCALPNNMNAEDAFSSIDDITVAPDDVIVKYMQSKENLQGLGYTGLDKTPVLATFRGKARRDLPVIDKGKKLAIAGEAFGVGAFEDDDESIYTIDDMEQYDFELGENNITDPKSSEKLKGDRATNYVGTILEGFHLSAAPMKRKTFYPAPFLPKTFQPFHQAKTEQDKNTCEPASSSVEQPSEVKHLNAVDRAAMIDNKTSLVATGSVFDYLKPEDKIRLQNIRKSIASPALPADAQPSLQESDESKSERLAITAAVPPSIPSNEEVSSKPLYSKSGAFQPFGQDESKQKRYETYVKLRDSKVEDAFSKCQPATMTEWEKQREMEEFRRAAAIYRPLSNQMASRFVSAKHSDLDEQPLNVMVLKEPKPTAPEAPKVPPTIKRESFEWHPDKLLCRRFNVPNPYPESQLVGILKVKRDKYSIFDFLTRSENVSFNKEESPKAIEASTPAAGEGPSSVLNHEKSEHVPEKSKETKLFAGLLSEEFNRVVVPKKTEDILAPKKTEEVVMQFNEQTTEQENDDKQERPPMDLFKAIFQDSDSENDSAPESEAVETAAETPSLSSNMKPFSLEDVIPIASKPSTSEKQERYPSATSGVFNIDFERLNQRPQSAAQPSDARKLPSIAVQVSKAPATNEENSVDFYGPALPPSIANAASREWQSFPSGDNELDMWTEAKPKKHKHKHKKSTKKKHGKSKHKHRRDHSSEEDSSSDDAKGLEEELLKKSKLLLKSRR